MCRYWRKTASLKMAAHGLMLTTCPLTMSKPVGAFIHELTDITKNVPVIPEMIIGKSKN